jgi:hypothetical protein
VHIKDGSSWSKFFLELSLLVAMKLMEMAFCSHCWAACLSASQMDVISVKIPLILDHYLAHGSWYFSLSQNIKMESTWDISWTRGTICCPSEPEIIMNTEFKKSYILLKKFLLPNMSWSIYLYYNIVLCVNISRTRTWSYVLCILLMYSDFEVISLDHASDV